MDVNDILFGKINDMTSKLAEMKTTLLSSEEQASVNVFQQNMEKIAFDETLTITERAEAVTKLTKEYGSPSN
jgi:hypothetical protein